MQALQAAREPLYGRFDLSLPVHPFDQHEAALILEHLRQPDRALVYGVVGGMPLYLSWWDQERTIDENLARLVCEPGSRLLSEADLVLRTDIDGGDYAQQVMHAIATGRTHYGQIKDYIRTEPQRTLDRLVELRLVERVMPAGESERAKRRIYRITDPFMRFYLGTAARYRTEIERGLGPSILPVLREAINDHMGEVWEEAFRAELRRRAVAGTLGVEGTSGVEGDVVAVGAWWDTQGQNEIDALVLAGRSATPVMVGEAKWSVTEDARVLVRALRRKVELGLRLDPDTIQYAVCARRAITNLDEGVLGLTAEDLFG